MTTVGQPHGPDHDKDKPHGPGADKDIHKDKDHKEGRVGVTPFTALVASQSLAAAATLTSSTFAYVPDGVVTATITNGAIPPSNACQVALQLTTDGVNWVEVDRRWGLFGPNAVSYQGFPLLGYGFSTPGDVGYADPRAWTNGRVVFSGNSDQAVTIAAATYLP